VNLPPDNTINDLGNPAFDFATVVETGEGPLSQPGFVSALRFREDFGNLRGIDRRGHVAIDDLHLAASRLVCDGRYLSFDNFAAVEADPDARAYAVIHIVKYTRNLSLAFAADDNRNRRPRGWLAPVRL
jgi:hypothetical protein